MRSSKTFLMQRTSSLLLARKRWLWLPNLQRATLNSCVVSLKSLTSYYYIDYDTICLINLTFCGAGAGVRDENGVRGIVDRPASLYFGRELFSDVFLKAASTLEGFSTTQFFRDGNKRTSFLTSTTFLACNGYDWFGPSVDEAEEFLLAVADNSHTIEEIARWLQDFSRPHFE